MQEFEDDALKQGCWQKSLFFAKHSLRDIARHKCHFCLAFCSVFIVVISMLVVNTVVAQGPIIFVSLAETDSGEMDFWYAALTYDTGGDLDMNSPVFDQSEHTLNYTQIEDLYGSE